jgi:hypothetical protein
MRQLKALGADGVLFADKRALSALKRSMEDIRGKWEAAETMLGSNPSELDRWKKEKPRLVWSTRYGSTKPAQQRMSDEEIKVAKDFIKKNPLDLKSMQLLKIMNSQGVW